MGGVQPWWWAHARRGHLAPWRVLAGAGRPSRRRVAGGPRPGWAWAGSDAREAGARAYAWEGRRLASSDGCGWRDQHNVALAGMTATDYVDGGRGWVPPPLAVLAWRGWSGNSRLQQRRLVAQTSAGWWWRQVPKIFIIVRDDGSAAMTEAACCVSRFRPDVVLGALGRKSRRW